MGARLGCRHATGWHKRPRQLPTSRQRRRPGGAATAGRAAACFTPCDQTYMLLHGPRSARASSCTRNCPWLLKSGPARRSVNVINRLVGCKSEACAARPAHAAHETDEVERGLMPRLHTLLCAAHIAYKHFERYPASAAAYRAPCRPPASRRRRPVQARSPPAPAVYIHRLLLSPPNVPQGSIHCLRQPRPLAGRRNLCCRRLDALLRGSNQGRTCRRHFSLLHCPIHPAKQHSSQAARSPGSSLEACPARSWRWPRGRQACRFARPPCPCPQHRQQGRARCTALLQRPPPASPPVSRGWSCALISLHFVEIGLTVPARFLPASHQQPTMCLRAVESHAAGSGRKRLTRQSTVARCSATSTMTTTASWPPSVASRVPPAGTACRGRWVDRWGVDGEWARGDAPAGWLPGRWQHNRIQGLLDSP